MCRGRTIPDPSEWQTSGRLLLLEAEERRGSMGIDYPLSIRNNWLCLNGRRDDTLTRGEPGVKQHRLAGEGGENAQFDSRFSVDASQLDHPQRAADGIRSMRVGARTAGTFCPVCGHRDEENKTSVLVTYC